MIVLACISAVSVFAFCTPSRFKTAYFLLLSVLLSAIYFFFAPPPEYDLFRYYQLLGSLKDVAFGDLFSSANYNKLLEQLQGTSKAFVAYAFVITRIPVARLLPVVTGILVYGISAFKITRMGKDMKASEFAVSAAFVAMLMLVDFRSVSTIRNMLAYALIAFIAYEDLVRNANKVYCAVLYFVVCQIHMTGALFVVIRLLVLACKLLPRWVVYAATALGFVFLPMIQGLLSHFTFIPYVDQLLYKTVRYILRYQEGIATYEPKRVFIFALYIAALFTIYHVCRKRGLLGKEYRQYNDFFCLTVFFTLGCFLQYDLFTRNTQLIILLSAPYLLALFNYYGPQLVGIGQRKVVSTAVVFACCFLLAAFVFNYHAFYEPMNQYFVFS